MSVPDTARREPSAGQAGLNVFVSYRRSDSPSAARQIADALKARFGPDSVFFDTRDLQPGTDWHRDNASPTSAVGSSTSSSGSTLRMELVNGQLKVHNGEVRVPMSCSTVTPGDVILLADSQRIAHKRFTCTPPKEKVRVRLNDAGRKLVADDDRVEATVGVLTGGETIHKPVALVSPRG